MPLSRARDGSPGFSSGGRAAALVLPVTCGLGRSKRLVGSWVAENTRPDISTRLAPEGFGMRPSSNPSIALSTLSPLDFKLPEGVKAQFLCPLCQYHRPDSRWHRFRLFRFAPMYPWFRLILKN